MLVDLQAGQVIGNRFEVVGTINRDNTWSDFYAVRDRETGKLALCEVESYDAQPVYLLRNNALITKELSKLGLGSIPKFIKYGYENEFQCSYYCTNLGGPSIVELRRGLLAEDPLGRFSLTTCLEIGQRTLRSLEELHNHGYIHREIKMDWFSIQPSEFMAIRLSMPRRWKNFDNTGPLPRRDKAPFRGNLKYASINALRQKDQSPLDDLWSWFYMLVDMTVGWLPWNGQLPPDLGIYEKLSLMAQLKQSAHDDPTQFLQNTPPEYTGS